MFIARADNNSLVIEGDERITSGSVNTNWIRFEFSNDWAGLKKTALFSTKRVCVPIILNDDNLRVAIPWEVMAYAKEEIKVGVYGTRVDNPETENIDEELILPTVWSTIPNKVEEGAKCQSCPPDASRPTPDSYFQLIELIENLTMGDISHNKLLGRDLPNQHPMGSITGLKDLLNRQDEINNDVLNDINSLTSRVDGVTQDLLATETDVDDLQVTVAQNVTSIASNAAAIGDVAGRLDQTDKDLTALESRVDNLKPVPDIGFNMALEEVVVGRSLKTTSFMFPPTDGQKTLGFSYGEDLKLTIFYGTITAGENEGEWNVSYTNGDVVNGGGEAEPGPVNVLVTWYPDVSDPPVPYSSFVVGVDRFLLPIKEHQKYIGVWSNTDGGDSDKYIFGGWVIKATDGIYEAYVAFCSPIYNTYVRRMGFKKNGAFWLSDSNIEQWKNLTATGTDQMGYYLTTDGKDLEVNDIVMGYATYSGTNTSPEIMEPTEYDTYQLWGRIASIDRHSEASVWINFQLLSFRLINPKQVAVDAGTNVTFDATMIQDSTSEDWGVKYPVMPITYDDYKALPEDGKKDIAFLVSGMPVDSDIPSKDNIYSSEEVRIGTYFGKPLYRCVWNATMPPINTEATLVTTTFVDKLVRSDVIVLGASGSYVPFPSSLGYAYLNNQYKVFGVLTIASDLASRPCTVALEYTKLGE